MTLIRQISAWLALLLALSAAALFYGSDGAAASLIFSALVLVVIGLGVASNTIEVTRGAVLGGLVLIGFAAASWLSGHFDSAAAEYASLATGGAIWMAGRSGGLKTDRAQALWRLTLGIGGAIATYQFFDFVLSPDTLYGAPRAYHVSRLAGPFLSANTAATFYGVFALMALGEVLSALRTSAGGSVMALVERSAFGAVVMLVCVTCLILSASRAGIGFFVISALILAGWQMWSMRASDGRGNWPAAVGAVLGVAALGLLFFELSAEHAVERLEHLDRGYDGRVDLIEAYWEAVWVAPWFGHGLGGFTYANLLIADAGNARLLLNQGAAHNVYLQWLLQGGLVGFGIMGAFMVAMLRSMMKGLGRRRRQRGYLKTVLVIVLFVGLHGWVDYALDVTGMMWWMAWVLGLGCGIGVGSSRKQT